MFVKSYLVMAFTKMWPVLIYLKKIRIIKSYSIMIWKILTPQRMNNICKDELAGSEDSKSFFFFEMLRYKRTMLST